MMIKAKNIIVKERTWINRVAQRERQRYVTNVKRSGERCNMLTVLDVLDTPRMIGECLLVTMRTGDKAPT